MDIAILRTEQAEREQLYNAVEYAATLHGARIVAYVDTGSMGSFRGFPIIEPKQLADWGVALVVAASPLPSDVVAGMASQGWPAAQLLSFRTQRNDCIALWRRHARWLSSRRPAMHGGELQMGVASSKILGPAVAPVAAPASPMARRAITARVLDAYKRADRDRATSGPYAAGRNWGSYLRVTRPNFYAAVAQNDVSALNDLLADCLRNEMTSGIFSNEVSGAVYRDYARSGDSVCESLRDQFNIWRASVSDADVSRLASPGAGNPYGVNVDGAVIHGDTLMNDYRAEAVLKLVRHVERPIILDLGGGFGSFCQQLMQHKSHGVYLGVDLPENLLVASYLLMVSQPTKRVLLYESADQPLDAATLAQYDIVLMPNFMLPVIDAGSVDVFTNFISLSEMNYETIAEYFRQVDRVCRGYFYHENLLDNGDNYEFYPVSTFPELANFIQVSSAPSRWSFFSASSPHHCHGEFTLMHRQIEHQRYLEAPTPARTRLAA